MLGGEVREERRAAAEQKSQMTKLASGSAESGSVSKRRALPAT
jgi:hypothetical protein